MKERFLISNASRYADQEVTIRGWVYQKRSSGKKLHFLIARDGTGIMQCVLFVGETDPASIEAFEKLTQESSVEVTGKLRKEPRSPGGYEMGVKNVKIVSIAHDYPITPKEHGIEFLMEHRHLWIRSSKQWATLRIRSQIIGSIHEFFRTKDFILFDAPILTGSSCEGTSTLFELKYFDDKAFLTQSGQLYGETGAMAFGNVYVFGPTFRAEKSKTRKHLTEFWMVEPEMAYANLWDSIDLGEALVQHVVKSVLEKCGEELKALERDVSKLVKIAEGGFPRISYDEALKVLEKRGVAIPWGEDFGAPHETALGEEFEKPVFVHHMPSQIKAFYFKQSDEIAKPGVEPVGVTGHGKYALGADLIAPDGFGEIIGGGQREESVETLKLRIQEHKLDEKDFSWYLDLRKYGSVPHSGFGMGVERVVSWICGSAHVRETIPYARMINTIKP